MLNFEYHNPVKIIFGKGTISKLGDLIDLGVKVMMTYGGGSIKKNGVYDQVISALNNNEVIEFSGIEPNPEYKTLMKAVEKAKTEKVDFLLSVGGGSVLDGTKFIAAAIKHSGADPWDFLTNRVPVEDAVPLGSVLTLPATGSEMNSYSVISRRETTEKFAFGSPFMFPKFSILDPETTYTLPEKQIANGVIDAYVHVLEQYLTYDVNSPLQDRQAEAILQTLIEEGPKTKNEPENYEARSNFMWSATQALNGLISCGVPQDWATHQIGHELTALFGIDHAQSLAIVIPAVMKYKKKEKYDKLLQYSKRIWKTHNNDDNTTIDNAIDNTEEFFKLMGAGTRLKDYNIGPDTPELVGARFTKRGLNIGEHADIDGNDVTNILSLCVE